jgi:2-polyprenyl-3-methyl-5-hydroxy-6-metoxy-1,4-benzoquinol methylase
MDIHRVALIFEDTSRPETTGVYCRRALEEIVQVIHFRPPDLERIPRTGFDLYLNIDDGLEYHLPDDLRPSAWWAIDTHLNFDWCRTKAERFDFVFAAQKDGAERLAEEAITSARWLPLACDPEIHRRHDVEKDYDLAFVGNLFPGIRSELVERLRRRYRGMYIGRAYFEEMARVYSAARIVFNRSLKNDVNMRVFEALACGSMLLTNEIRGNGQEAMFRDGVHLATYQGTEEMLDKTAYYLEHDSVRERIAAAGMAEVVAKHTYRHRMNALLEQVARESAQRVSGGHGELGRTRQERQDTPRPVPSVIPLQGGYFEFARPELLELVPPTARRVLEVGCGAGKLGESIKLRQDAEVVGIELVPEAAERARDRLDEVHLGDAETLPLDFTDEPFDCVVCGDVLEHMREPETFLRRVRGWLEPDGVLVASIPNVRHHSIVSALLEGNWTYEPAGLLDETHLRFFTRSDILDLFEDAGYANADLKIIPGSGYEQWQEQGYPGEVQVGRLHVAGLVPQDAEEFFVYQYLLVARPSSSVQEELPADDHHSKPDSNDPVDAVHEPAAPAASGASLILVGEDSTEKPNPSRTTHQRGSGRMRFTQEFLADFDQFDFFGRPFAFVRFGDGERSICRGAPITNCDGWAYDGSRSQFAVDLNASLAYNDSSYYIGISDSCCDPRAHEWLLQRVTVPLEQVTFANIFVNANYRRFRKLDLSKTALVSSEGGEFTVPEHLINSDFDLDALVEQLLCVDRPILVAAGPASCILIHKYWMRAGENRQTIVDIGSALDEVIKGRRTRSYHHPGSPTANRVCRW